MRIIKMIILTALMLSFLPARGSAEDQILSFMTPTTYTDGSVLSDPYGELAGFRVYYSTVSGGPYALLVDKPISNGNCLKIVQGTSSRYDCSLQANLYGLVSETTGTYYCVATVYDVNGNESGYSNEASKSPKLGTSDQSRPVTASILFRPTDLTLSSTLLMQFLHEKNDGTAVPFCNGDTSPTCLKSIQYYVSQTSYDDVYPTPTVSPVTISGEWTMWCAESVNGGNPIYVSHRFVYGDDSVSPLSKPAFQMPGMVYLDGASYDSACTDGLSWIRVNWLYSNSTQITWPSFNVSMCPAYSGTDIVFGPQTDTLSGDIYRLGEIGPSRTFVKKYVLENRCSQ